ncbi:hypothetical protein PROFUN_02441 [Planoprotostelium fungivorum]|uniref:DEP domain-containing protein n=1 Tax=Planoprotostelium fungivorum TaxID=1890364 RepID=A0A2P6NUV1_9EUKA|nr:hypothetical protein PROFUN_02441 [Planoprotostelium fungivorum]
MTIKKYSLSAVPQFLEGNRYHRRAEVHLLEAGWTVSTFAHSGTMIYHNPVLNCDVPVPIESLSEVECMSIEFPYVLTYHSDGWVQTYDVSRLHLNRFPDPTHKRGECNIRPDAIVFDHLRVIILYSDRATVVPRADPRTSHEIPLVCARSAGIAIRQLRKSISFTKKDQRVSARLSVRGPNGSEIDADDSLDRVTRASYSNTELATPPLIQEFCSLSWPLLLRGGRKMFQVWNLQTGKLELQGTPHDHFSTFSFVKWNPKSGRLLTVSGSVLDLYDLHEKKAEPLREKLSHMVTAIVMDDIHVIAADTSGILSSRSSKTLEKFGDLNTIDATDTSITSSTDAITCLQIHRDDPFKYWVYVGHESGRLASPVTGLRLMTMHDVIIYTKESDHHSEAEIVEWRPDESTFNSIKSSRSSFAGEISAEPQIMVSLEDLRRKMKSKCNVRSNTGKPKRQASLIAFRLGMNKDISEKEIDKLVLRLLHPSEGIRNLGKRRIDGKWQLRTFSGKEGTNWLMERLGHERGNAVQIIQTALMNRGIIRSLSRSHVSFHDSSDIYYHFVLYDGGIILNEAKTAVEKHDPVELSEKLMRRVARLIADFSNGRGWVDWKGLVESPLYVKFLLRITRLQNIDPLTELSWTKRLIFTINIYNCLSFHLQCLSQENRTLRKEMSSTKMYVVGSSCHCLQELLAVVTGRFVPEPSRAEWCRGTESVTDPLVHFCLLRSRNFGGYVPVFSPEGDLMRQLEVNARLMLSPKVMLTADAKKIFLPRSFVRYQRESLSVAYQTSKASLERVIRLLELTANVEELSVETEAKSVATPAGQAVPQSSTNRGFAGLMSGAKKLTIRLKDRRASKSIEQSSASYF